ncbi:MAG: hypothetical protein COT15_02460 [Candidatus Diapherotrites archaeon CG08_land_8_20_14_0_20_34_12]|nr:MAG: hypothetical protein COT15_02460 [Candidatus Diapherotrites archaeon CG08_land_8_20_14_0_20_34_12]
MGTKLRGAPGQRKKESGKMTGGEIVETMVEQARVQLNEFTRDWSIKTPVEKAGFVEMLLGTLQRYNTLTYNFNPFLDNCSIFCLKVLADPAVPSKGKLDAAKILKLIMKRPGSLAVRTRIDSDQTLMRQAPDVRQILGIK